VDIKSGLGHVLDQIEREKGIKKEDILRTIEQAMVSAYKKHAGENLNVIAHIELSGGIAAYLVKTIVETVTIPDNEISLAEAKKIDPNAQVGGDVHYPIDTTSFERIAAQTAKQVLTQKMRETEREYVYDEFKPKEGQLISGTVHRFTNKNVIVDLGRAEGILPVREQVRREHWTIGERIRALLLKVEKGPRGPEIVLSRAHDEFVKKLFEQEVPEIYDKTIRVVSVVREPGHRAKVVVQSYNSKVDPVGACVGVKGSRVRPIIIELQGERIDLVPYSEDPATYIGSALTPAKPVSVSVDVKSRKAEALVPDDALALAIGKNGQNIRLACKLTGWQIDVKTESQKRVQTKTSTDHVKAVLLSIDGVVPRTADLLIKSGLGSLEKIALSSVENLTAVPDIDAALAEKIIASVKAALLNPAAESAPKEPAEPSPSGEEPQEGDIVVEESVNGHAEAPAE
jgi:transcription termination/antitermination protein NusA